MRRAWLILSCFGAVGCHRGSAAPELPPAVSEATTPLPRSAPTPALPQMQVAWRDAPVFVGDVPRGPGFAAQARVGSTLFVQAHGGRRWTQVIEEIETDICEEGETVDQCARISLGEVDDQPPVPGSWSFPGASADVDDIALLPTALASMGPPLPMSIDAPIEVRYHNALCEGGEDDKHYALLTKVSSTGLNPLAGAPFLSGHAKHPRRVVTVRFDARSLHFVTASDVPLPPSRRMYDLKKDRVEFFWVVEELADHELTVIHEERRQTKRDINRDYSCQLPLDFALPFAAVIEDRGRIDVYARSTDTFERWAWSAGAPERDATWSLGTLHELF